MKILLVVLTMCSLFFNQQLRAENLNLMRRWVVFPFDSEASLKNAAERAWWKSREILTSKKKYLVASRQFLQEKDVMQPRRNLRIDDVKLLGKLLDADVLVTGFSEKRQFTLNIYLVQTGQLFWSKHIKFHPSLKADDQLELISDRLINEAMAHIPYQAFTVIDPLINKSVYEDSGKFYAVVDVGNTEDLAEGDDIQWINVSIPAEAATTSDLISTARDTVVAEGKIVKVKKGVVIAEVLKAKDKDDPINVIYEKSLVRISKESALLAKELKNTHLFDENLAPELVPDSIPLTVVETKVRRKAPTIIGSILGFLAIIAFAL
jgi:hypothetical protein